MFWGSLSSSMRGRQESIASYAIRTSGSICARKRPKRRFPEAISVTRSSCLPSTARSSTIFFQPSQEFWWGLENNAASAAWSSPVTAASPFAKARSIVQSPLLSSSSHDHRFSRDCARYPVLPALLLLISALQNVAGIFPTKLLGINACILSAQALYYQTPSVLVGIRSWKEKTDMAGMQNMMRCACMRCVTKASLSGTCTRCQA